MWTCPKCGEKVESDFEICWSCGTSQDGVEDPEFVKESDPVEVPAPRQEEAVKAEKRATEPIKADPCRACGSFKVIPNVEVLDQGESSDGYLKVVLYGDPQALIFKDRLYGQLRAWICGDCGHAELRVMNPEELYLKYLEAKERGKA